MICNAQLCDVMIAECFTIQGTDMATVSSPGGLEYQFVTPPQNMLLCKICHLPSRDPHLTICCGHVFCKSCLDGMKAIESVIKNICPMCRDKDFVTFPNKQIDREVKSLHVYCTNKGRGCEWKGEVNYINNHLTKGGGCEYEDVMCTSGCGGVIQRRDLTKHIETECPCRKVNCQYCQLGAEHQFIEGKHKEECVEYPLACPNKCGETRFIPRKDMDEHRSRCPLEMIDCEYHTMGCEVKTTREMQKEHNKEKMEYHLHLTKCKLDETRCELSKAVIELTKTKEELSDVKDQFADRITLLEALQHSQSSSASNTISPKPETMSPYQWSKQLYSTSQVSSPGNQIIPVTFKMTGLAKKLKTNRDWYSDPFYTDVMGYRIRLCIDVGGDGDCKGTHCSMFLRLMRGRYDDDLSWPLKTNFQIVLLNQINDDHHQSHTVNFIKAINERDVTHRVFHRDMAKSAWGSSSFITHEHLKRVTNTCQFLKDDCIFIRVSKP